MAHFLSQFFLPHVPFQHTNSIVFLNISCFLGFPRKIRFGEKNMLTVANCNALDLTIQVLHQPSFQLTKIIHVQRIYTLY